MTPNQAKFVREYLVDLNATQAAIRAGYSAKTAQWVGPRLVTKSHVAAAIAEGMQRRSKRTEITADRVLQELARVAFSDLRKLYNDDGSLKAPKDWDDDTAGSIAGIETVEQQTVEVVDGEIKRAPTFTKKVKVFDKNAALTMAMRHLGMFEQDNKQVGGGFVELLAMANGRKAG